jgi:hypothetical protein
MVLMELAGVILRLVRTYQLLVGSLVVVVHLQYVLAVLVLVLWVLQASQYRVMAQTPLYMVSLAAVMLAFRDKQETLLDLVAALAVAVVIRLFVMVAVLIKEAQVVVLAQGVAVQALVARAVLMLDLLVAVVWAVRLQQHLQVRAEQAERVLSVKVVAVVALAAVHLVWGALAVRVVLVLVAAVAARQMLDQILVLAVMVAMACAVSTLGKEQI